MQAFSGNPILETVYTAALETARADSFGIEHRISELFFNSHTGKTGESCFKLCRLSLQAKKNFDSESNKISKFITYLRCKRSELRTTEIELIAIAAEAIIGFSLPIAATGIATVL